MLLAAPLGLDYQVVETSDEITTIIKKAMMDPTRRLREDPLTDLSHVHLHFINRRI